MLTAKQHKAISAILACQATEQAAKMAGCSSRTIRTYMKDAEFQRELQRAFSSLTERAARDSQRSLSVAVQTLRGICEDPEENAQVRVSAARSLLEYGLRLTEAADTLSRVDALEQKLGV